MEIRYTKSFLRFAETAQNIAEARDSSEKITLCSDYLKSLPDLNHQKNAIQYLSEGAFPSEEKKRLGISHKSIEEAACQFLEIDFEYVFKTCKKATGSSSETIEKLMDYWPKGIQKRKPELIAIQEIATFFETLLLAKKKEEKIDLLLLFWKQLTPLEIKFLIRLFHPNSIQIGLNENLLLQIISKTFSQSKKTVSHAFMITRSWEKTLENSKENTLEKLEFSFFKPLDFILATSFSRIKSIDFEGFICEELLNGLRCQVHISDGNIELYSRDLKSISSRFPKLISFFKNRDFNNLILDGQIIVFKDDELLPFEHLNNNSDEFPISFIAYDILADGNQLLVQNPLSERKKRLFELSKTYGLPISVFYPISSFDDIKSRLLFAQEHGNDGLILKRLDSNYEFGKRFDQWIKLKQKTGTLNTVLLYAHSESGNRGGNISEFTLGIRDNQDKKDNTPIFLPIGKVKIPESNNYLNWLNKEIRGIILERFGPTLSLKPQIIVEIEFDGIFINKRTKAGFSLNSPQFKSIYHDITISDVDSIEDVKNLYNSKFLRKRLKNLVEPFGIFPI